MANALDTSIILGGRQPDIVATLTNAAMGGQQARQFKQRNALDTYLQGRGTDVMNGDPQAMNALAQFGVQGVEFGQGVQANNLSMDNTRQTMQARTQSMGLADSQEQRALETHLAGLSKIEREEAQRMLEGALTQAIPALQAGDLDGINQIMTAAGQEPVGSLQEAQIAIASADTAYETLKRMSEMSGTSEKKNIVTGSEALALGLDPTKSYNVTNGPNGTEATAIGGSGVSVTNTIGGDGEIGTIPQGFEVYRDADGNRAMRKIPGGPEDTTKAETSQIDATRDTLALISSVRDSSFLPQITGMFQGRLPAFTQGGTDLQVKIDQLKGKAFMQAFESLKGGGAISEREGTAAAEAQARLNQAQSEKAYKEALDELYTIMDRGIYRLENGIDVRNTPVGGPDLPPVGGPDIPPAGGQGIVVYTPDQIMTMPQDDFNAMTTEQLRALSPEARQAIRERVAAAQQGGIQ